ncbi:Signal peptidase I T [Actinomyces bovis]|uniref:Signal peptidase I n=1 Tax=Actinomyces bovis TaxID=1658 RepID=A0ABY1VLU8_9ACTO|nr:signal peptidase I [Actinomyces bovis]SPT52652.1 Signal peptidase I T [Actinomyces bovis]VEG54548.1 Signal peptidase I T [Actinomyces israelii]
MSQPKEGQPLKTDHLLADAETAPQDPELDPPLPPSIPPRKSSKDEAENGHKAHGSTLLVVVVILILAALFKSFVVQTYEIPSSSMENTLAVGDRVAVTMYNASNIKRGDIVVFVDPGGWLTGYKEPTGVKKVLRDVLEFTRLLPAHSGHHLIKRVIGMPGDHVISDGKGSLSVNGVEISEGYIKPGVSASDIAFDVTVPAGYVWLMGDNRSNSLDSRLHQDDANHGFVPLDNVVGVARYLFLPVSRWAVLDEEHQAFSRVPEPTTLPSHLPPSHPATAPASPATAPAN